MEGEIKPKNRRGRPKKILSNLTENLINSGTPEKVETVIVADRLGMSDILDTTGSLNLKHVNPTLNNSNQEVNPGLLSLIAANSSKGYSNGDSGSYWMDSVIANGQSDLRKDVQESRRDIKETESTLVSKIGDVECAVKLSESALKTELANQSLAFANRFSSVEKSISDVAVAVLKAEYEGKLATQTAIKEINSNSDAKFQTLTEKVDHEAEELSEKIDHCCEEVRETLCAFEKNNDAHFAKLSEDALAKEVRDLREENALLQIKVSALNVGK